MTSYLEVDKVEKRFTDNWVLRGIDMSVNEHEVVCLIGASGSGKSTLLRCINLLERVDGGSIFINGDCITDVGVDVDEVRREVGIVFQSFNLFPHMTVMKNITLAPDPGPRAEQGLRGGRRDARCSSASASSTSATSTPTACRAASNSGSPSCARWQCSRACCSSTRSRARSIPSWWPKC